MMSLELINFNIPLSSNIQSIISPFQSLFPSPSHSLCLQLKFIDNRMLESEKVIPFLNI